MKNNPVLINGLRSLLAWVGIRRYLGVYFSSAIERLNAVLTTVKLVFTAHLTPFTVVLIVVLRLK